MRTQIRTENGIAILEPNGKIVGSSVSELRDVISPQIETSEHLILINFGKVNKIDGSGLFALMEVNCSTDSHAYNKTCLMPLNPDVFFRI